MSNLCNETTEKLGKKIMKYNRSFHKFIHAFIPILALK